MDHVFYSSLPESGFHGVVERQFYFIPWGGGAGAVEGNPPKYENE